MRPALHLLIILCVLMCGLHLGESAEAHDRLTEYARNAATDGMRRSSNACAIASRSRKNIGPADKMIG